MRQFTNIKDIGQTISDNRLWNLGYSERRVAIEQELTTHLDDDAVSDLSCQFPLPCDYDGEGTEEPSSSFTCKLTE